jgi:hypothetical protein
MPGLDKAKSELLKCFSHFDQHLLSALMTRLEQPISVVPYVRVWSHKLSTGETVITTQSSDIRPSHSNGWLKWDGETWSEFDNLEYPKSNRSLVDQLDQYFAQNIDKIPDGYQKL